MFALFISSGIPSVWRHRVDRVDPAISAAISVYIYSSTSILRVWKSGSETLPEIHEHKAAVLHCVTTLYPGKPALQVFCDVYTIASHKTQFSDMSLSQNGTKEALYLPSSFFLIGVLEFSRIHRTGIIYWQRKTYIKM